LSDQRQSAPEPRNEVDLPETFKSELHGTTVILDIRNLAKSATNLVYLVRVAIGQRCQAPTGARDWLSALRRIPPKLEVPAFDGTASRAKVIRQRPTRWCVCWARAVRPKLCECFPTKFSLHSSLPSLRRGGRNFERQGAVQGARHPVRGGRLATLALYSWAFEKWCWPTNNAWASRAHAPAARPVRR